MEAIRIEHKWDLREMIERHWGSLKKLKKREKDKKEGKHLIKQKDSYIV